MKNIIETIIDMPFTSLSETLSQMLTDSKQLIKTQEDVASIFASAQINDNQNDKTILSVCGIPASGKSYYINNLINSTHKNFYYIAFDRIMENLQIYQERKQIDKIAAFCETEKIAMIIGYYLLCTCIGRGMSVLFEHSNTLVQHIALYQIMKYVHGYNVHIRYLNVPLELSLTRASKRERHCPQEYIHARYSKLSELLPIYKAIADDFVEIHSENPI